MNIIFDNLCKDYEGKIVFSGISGRIDKNDKIGLIGVNGSGKTTLAKILSGIEGYEQGSITYSPKELKIVYMNQVLNSFENANAYEFLFDLVEGKDKKSKELKIRKSLDKVGLKEDCYNKPVKSLSGGEKTKLMLCKVLVEEFDLLILDEPTNHLDMESIKWLEEFIIKLNKTIIIISHDRYFLDKTSKKIWELSSKELKEYEGNYTKYRYQKEIETRNTLREYEKQQDKIEHLKDIIEDRKNWFNKAHKAAGQNDFLRSKSKKHVSVMKAKKKELERVESNRIERPKEETAACFDILNKGVINTKLPQYLVQGKNLDKSYGDKIIFKDAAFSIMRGERAALIGSNGAGKSTLFKMINGIDRNYGGSITINPSVKIGYFAQEIERLDYEKSILDNVMSNEITQGEARLLLASLLFRGDAVFKKVTTLSMGEKCRVAFAKLILSGANLLILDEPTNYMDIVSKEKIEEILAEFKGSIIFVSHDRYFINKLATRIIKIDEQKLISFEGSYEEYEANDNEKKKIKTEVNEYKNLKDIISKLEFELAFLSGKLGEKLSEEEKKNVENRFIETARQINQYKDKLKCTNYI